MIVGGIAVVIVIFAGTAVIMSAFAICPAAVG
jgi:hypothetical protein